VYMHGERIVQIVYMHGERIVSVIVSTLFYDLKKADTKGFNKKCFERKCVRLVLLTRIPGDDMCI